MSVWKLSKMEQDAVAEIMNISMGASATSMSEMLGRTVRISLPMVSVQSETEFSLTELNLVDSVEVEYTEGLVGKSVLLFKRQDLGVMTGLAMGEGDVALTSEDSDLWSVAGEIMNQMMGASATALAEFLGREIRISSPSVAEVATEAEFKKQYFDRSEPMVIVRFTLEIDGKLQSIFLNMLPVKLAKEMIEPFAAGFTDSEDIAEPQQGETTEQAEETAAPEKVKTMEKTQNVEAAEISGGNQKTDNGMEEMFRQMQQTQREMLEMMQGMKENEVKKEKPAENSVIRPLSPTVLEDRRESTGEDKANQEMLLQVPLEVSVEIGRTKKLVRDILEFTEGSLVVLDKMAGEQVDLFVNGQCIAKGDIVVVEDNFGIRITEILPGSIC